VTCTGLPSRFRLVNNRRERIVIKSFGFRAKNPPTATGQLLLLLLLLLHKLWAKGGVLSTQYLLVGRGNNTDTFKTLKIKYRKSTFHQGTCNITLYVAYLLVIIYKYSM